MHDIEMQTATEEFSRCWREAGRHMQAQVQGGIGWLKASLNPPFLEHLSFRLGNQLFFVRIESTDTALRPPGSRAGLLAISRGCNGHACIMPMVRRGGAWGPSGPGWGLVDLQSGRPVDPVSLVSDEQIEMTDWELQDFAVQVVRDAIAKEGRELMSWQGDPGVDPSIWFVGDQGPEWVVVRAARYPAETAAVPANWDVIADRCARLGKAGHFASVAVASTHGSFDPSGKPPATPLWRGHGMHVRYGGMKRLT
jgi:hypothetical protein